MNRKIINEIFEIFQKTTPQPRTELSFSSNFTLAVAVILSAQSTDISVNKATKELFVKYNTPEAILALGEEGLKKYIKIIGLYNTKAKNIISFCQQLILHYNSEIPNKFAELIKLPGIGRKTANVILNCAFSQPTMAVDTHVYRVANRTGLSKGKNPLQVETDLIAKIPKKWLTNAHHWLILHGRYTCKARKPTCSVCLITNYCQYYKKHYGQ